MAKVKAKFRVACTSKAVSGARLFDLPFKGAETPKQAIKLARAYARKKGIDPRRCKFEAFDQP